MSLLALGQLRSEVPPTRFVHCVLSRFAQGSSAWCNRERIAQVPEQLTLNQRVAGSSPAAPTNAIKSLEYPKALLWFIAAQAGSTPEALTGSPPTQALRATLDRIAPKRKLTWAGKQM